jgi:hypothetical protein
MARYIGAIDLAIEDAFDYLADFSRAAVWDPGVCEAKRITRRVVRLGNRKLARAARKVRADHQEQGVFGQDVRKESA